MLAGVQLGMLALAVVSTAAPITAQAAAPGESTSPSPCPVSAELWSSQREPAAGPAQAIGGCSGGCLQGAVSLPPTGSGYRVIHPWRRRSFGHPSLVAFIRRLAETAQRKKLGLVAIGDLSQARGGPTPSGHRSHQSGLDADIGYSGPLPARGGKLGSRSREAFVPAAVVDLQTLTTTTAWNPKVASLLEAAASDPSVDRIFVHPVVKRELCAGPARGSVWLARIRPWWLHHDHFHVRLKCPDGSPLCTVQDPPNPDAGDPDGCGSGLAWWFSEDANRTRRQRATGEERVVTLPSECADLLSPPRAASR